MLSRIIDRCIVFDTPYTSLDVQTADKYKKNLLKAYLSSAYSDMILNLSKVTFIDAAGLESLLFAGGLVQEANGKLSLYGVNPYVRSILLQSRLYRYFDINRTLEESLEFIKDAELSETCNYQLLRKKINPLTA